MTSLKENAYAKINLTLDVIGKREDSYHLIRSVMQPISLCDIVTVTKTETDDITISCNDANVPCDKRNTAYKAAKKFFEFTGIKDSGIDIAIDKRIPSEAGLGGGSSDAAAVIKLLDKMFDTKLSIENMITIGAKVGADVPFCIVSKTALCEGMGEVITPIKELSKYYILLIKPDFGVSTPLAYRLFDEKKISSGNSTDKLIEAINSGDDICKLLSNDLESAISDDRIQAIMETLLAYGADGAMMSGSGSCVYGLFKNKSVAEKANKALNSKYQFVYLAETI